MAISRLLMLGQADDIITVIILVLGGLWWLFRKLAEGQGERRPPQTPPQGDQGTTFVADEEEVQRFLQSLGQPPAPPQPPPARPQPVQHPRRPPVRPQPVQMAPAPEEQTTTVRLVKQQQATGAFAADYAFGTEGPSPPAAAALRHQAPAAAPTARKKAAHAASSAAERLEFPRLSRIQRAIVLSEILGRKYGPYRPGMRP